jgi:hypothetical protein
VTAPATAMVLAAGLGTRMRPLTDDRPKALVEVGGAALIDHVLRRLGESGVERAVVNVHWFAERLESHLAARAGGPEILISDERAELLETGGGLKKAAALLGSDPVFVANIDSVWTDNSAPGDTALNQLARLWNPSIMDAALLLARREGSIGFEGGGDFFLADDGRLTFRGDAPEAPFAYMGVHICRPDYVADGPEGPFSLSGFCAAFGGGGAAVRLRAGRRLDARRRPRSPRRGRGETGRNMTARFDPFAAPGPRWYAIEARRPFLDDLAAGVLDWLGDHPPETLSDAVILLPNRRAARAFTAALTKQAGGRPILLPQVRPLGDLEEDEPPFAPGRTRSRPAPGHRPLTRRFEMARMIVEDFRPGLSPLRALEMADALGGFLDSCQLEEVEDLHRVATLVEGDLAEHWRESAEFLALAVEAWPKRLEAMGLVDPAWRRARLLRLLAKAWTDRPPTQTVIAAGSTGTAPAAADVLAAVARRPARLCRPARPRPRPGSGGLGHARRQRTAPPERPVATADGRAPTRGRAAVVPAGGPVAGARPRPPAADQRGPAPRRRHRRLARP